MWIDVSDLPSNPRQDARPVLELCGAEMSPRCDGLSNIFKYVDVDGPLLKTATKARSRAPAG